MTVMLLQNNVCVYSNNNNNNNHNNNVSKSGPSTIEDQYRQHLKNGANLNESRPRLNVFSLQNTGSVKKGKAMNYYRLWIYTCNAVLLISVLGFVIVAGRVVVVDPRRKLIPGLSLHHPSLLYAYLALLTQSGLLQLLGCIGALKLNERLLNMYWLLLLFLLFGDALIGIVWIFRFDKMYTDLKPILKQRLQMEYGMNEEFTIIWDSIQHDFQCCGVEGPQDFNDIELTRRNLVKADNKKVNESIENRVTFIENPDGYDKNRVLSNRTLKPTEYSYSPNYQTKDFTSETTVPEENVTETLKDVDGYTNWLLSNIVTMSSSSNDFLIKDSNIKYVHNVPESCCRILKETIPDEKQIEEVEETESKPTTIRQRLLKKKKR